jgi:Domain of unknown function (DUF6089)
MPTYQIKFYIKFYFSNFAFMKKILFCILVCSFYTIHAQRIELGGGLGPTFYKGDLQPTFRPLNPRAAMNIFARYNYNRVFSFKANGMAGFVGGNDSKSGNKLNTFRDFSFIQTIGEYNVQAEYNFLNFRTHNGHYESEWTPYLFGGLGQFISLSRSFDSPYAPPTKSTKATGGKLAVFYGIGYKKILNNRWNYGVEFGTRIPTKAKYNDTTFDGFGYDEDAKPQTSYFVGNINPMLEYPNTPQPDKYFYVSFSVSYLFYKVYCPPK